MVHAERPEELDEPVAEEGGQADGVGDCGCADEGVVGAVALDEEENDEEDSE